MVAWIGGKQVPLPYDRKARVAGESKYPLSKMVRFAADAITAFSVVPLMAAVGLLGGMQFLMLGIIGAYLGRLYDQSKGRPLFMIRDIVGGPK